MKVLGCPYLAPSTLHSAPRLVDKNCHPDGAKRQKDSYQVAPMLAEHLAGLMQNCRQNPLSVVEKIDKLPSLLTAFSPQDDNFYLPALMINGCVPNESLPLRVDKDAKN